MRLPVSMYDKVIGITLALCLRKIIKLGFKTPNKTLWIHQKATKTAGNEGGEGVRSQKGGQPLR